MRFVSENIAIKLQKLGFDEPCMAKYTYATENFTEGSTMSLYPHTQDFFKGSIETCRNSHYENSMNANGNIPVICAPDLLTTILWIGEKYHNRSKSRRMITLERDGFSDNWCSCYDHYLTGEPYEILEKNIDHALDVLIKEEMLNKN